MPDRYDEDRALQNAAVTSPLYMVNPLFGLGATTLSLLSGFAGGGGNDVSPGNPYYTPEGTGVIGGYNYHPVYSDTSMLSDSQVLQTLAPTYNPAVTPQWDPEAGAANLYGTRAPGEVTPGQWVDPLNDLQLEGWDDARTQEANNRLKAYAQAESEWQWQLRNAELGGTPLPSSKEAFFAARGLAPTQYQDPLIQQLTADWRAQNPEMVTGESATPWAVDQGMADVGLGTQTIREGLGMQDRSPVSLNMAQINAARGGVTGLADQAAIDRAMTGQMLEEDRLRLADVFGTGQQTLRGNFDAGVQGLDTAGRLTGDQLAYMQAVQRGEAGPSLAEVMSNRVLGEQIQNQMAMAKSGSSFNPAAQRQAALAGQQMMDTQRQQLAELRAQEQMAAQGQVGNLLGLQQQGAQNYAGFRMGGAESMGQYGLQGAGQLGELGLHGGSTLAGMTQGQQNAALGLMGQEAGIASTGAALTDSQRARDDAFRQYLASLGLDIRGGGYQLMQQQAANDLAREGINAGATQAANNLALQGNIYNQNRSDTIRGQNLQAWGSLAQGVANITAANRAGQATQQQQPSYQQQQGQAAGQSAYDSGRTWNEFEEY